MKHQLEITTVEALVLKKSLRLADFQNDTDRMMADRLIDKINGIVDKDLKERKERNKINYD